MTSTVSTGCQQLPLSECLEEITSGVGADWQRYRVVGATRQGLAPAKEDVGKNPQRYKLVRPGTIFYNPMRILLGSIAMIGENDEPGITSPDYVVFRTRPGVMNAVWFYYWLRSVAGDAFIRTLARGAVRERLLFTRLEKGIIAVPAITSQEAFARSMSIVEKARQAVEDQLAALDALPAALLRRAFSGELA
jgi:type I restriction enzyme S subunit